MSTKTHLYITQPEFIPLLKQELGECTPLGEMGLLSATAKPDICFALDVWPNVTQAEISSINDGAAKLRMSGSKLWHQYKLNFIRRGTLISDNFKKLSNFTVNFPPREALPQIGGFSLLEQNQMLFCPKRWKSMPDGIYEFNEDKEMPPSRAYLKLWEALSLWGEYPQAGETCIDLGSCPGGWTYVLQSLGATVISVDKAPLAPHIAKLPGIKYLQQSAFALNPAEFERIDWLVCDIICYPERLLSLIESWLATGNAKRMICTVKLQGEPDWAIINKLAAIPQARVLHLSQNKHELTFFYPAPKHLWVNFEN
ncbi:MAG: SAM-dependent methyltransferase [Gammaproteobacteria bacterium]|nr:SAM-dependent methyltransferase [Gammaproteobacteria bacterium]